MPRRAFITGITGQDGSYLAELLLSEGYEVHGLVRRVALENQRQRLGRIEHLLDRVTLHAGSLESYPSIFRIFGLGRFDECYHLAAQSYVAESFADGFSTMKVNIAGTQYVLDALRQLQPECRFYFAGSSEMFGKAREAPQIESTPFHPRSPYGISKVTGFHLTRNFRESYGLYCATGILFNHESPRRGLEFVTRKITMAAARIRAGLDTTLSLGNLDARRDWGHAREYVRAMHLMLQQDEPDDFVIATGETHTVRECCEIAFDELGLAWQDHVRIDDRLLRPAEVDILMGNAQKAKTALGWSPRIGFEALLREMARSDLELVRAGRSPTSVSDTERSLAHA